MLPEHRLASLLQQVKDNQVKKCVWHNGLNAPNLYTDHHCDRNQFPHYNARVLTDHSDEVLSVQFSNDGRRLASASRDKTIIVWDVDVRLLVSICSDYADQLCRRGNRYTFSENTTAQLQTSTGPLTARG